MTAPRQYSGVLRASRWILCFEILTIAILALGCGVPSAHAGGGGQNLFLIVNQNDEHALRIASAYQQLRWIPDRNVFFYDPPDALGFDRLELTGAQVDDLLLQVDQAITARGLANQIDYLAGIGIPFRFRVAGSNNSLTDYQSIGNALMHLEQYRGGLDPVDLTFTDSALFQGTTGFGTATMLDYLPGENSAIHHDQVYPVGDDDYQYYLAGLLGFTGMFGATAEEVVTGLMRSAGSDGARPAGTIYFENNNDVRTTTRRNQWPVVQTALTARGIPFIQEDNIAGATPKDRMDVRGAVVGAANPVLPNGSTYLAGSWADNFTSLGADFFGTDQTKATKFLQAGAGATSGSVAEPFALDYRFPDAAIFLFVADGSTLAEAFFKSLEQPVLMQFFGDLLAQPYADVPQVTLTTAPPDGQTVSGSIAIEVSAALTAPVLATAVDRIDLYIDGVMAMTSAGATATFNVSTLSLSDGRHEFRAVAVNNAQAESENFEVRHYFVDNHGRSVSAPGGDVVAAASDVVRVPVAAINGDGMVDRVELRHLGRVLGEVAAAVGSIDLDATMMPFGDGEVTPVAVYTDSQQVAGAPFVFTRSPDVLPGALGTQSVNRIAGVRIQYYPGGGGASIADSDFSGTPVVDRLFERAFMKSAVSTGLGGGLGVPVDDHPVSEMDELALRVGTRFEVGPGEAGEYSFMTYRCNDSVRLSIDGVTVFAYDDMPAGVSGLVNAQGHVFLGEGEHVLEYLAANRSQPAEGGSQNRFDVALWMRGPDGVTMPVDQANCYVTRARVERIDLLVPSKDIKVTVETILGAEYQLQWSTAAQGWTDMGTPFTATMTTHVFIDSGPPSTPVAPALAPERFYRALRIR